MKHLESISSEIKRCCADGQGEGAGKARTGSVGLADTTYDIQDGVYTCV